VNHIGGTHVSGDKQQLDDKFALGSTANNMGAVGNRVMNINFRRTYALAPCHHLFHTDCLNQWMAIKVCRCYRNNDEFLNETVADFGSLCRTLVRFVNEVYRPSEPFSSRCMGHIHVIHSLANSQSRAEVSNISQVHTRLSWRGRSCITKLFVPVLWSIMDIC